MRATLRQTVIRSWKPPQTIKSKKKNKEGSTTLYSVLDPTLQIQIHICVSYKKAKDYIGTSGILFI
jgi:hypothetical protein